MNPRNWSIDVHVCFPSWNRCVWRQGWIWKSSRHVKCAGSPGSFSRGFVREASDSVFEFDHWRAFESSFHIWVRPVGKPGAPASRNHAQKPHSRHNLEPRQEPQASRSPLLVSSATARSSFEGFLLSPDGPFIPSWCVWAIIGLDIQTSFGARSILSLLVAAMRDARFIIKASYLHVVSFVSFKQCQEEIIVMTI